MFATQKGDKVIKCTHDIYLFVVLFSPPRLCSGVAPPKTGLQWQQPFLELVLACMHAQTTTHEELLGPLKTQLSTFLAAFEKVWHERRKRRESSVCILALCVCV